LLGLRKQHLLVAEKDGPQCRALLGNLPEGGNVYNGLTVE
jgi:hypothetical protein